MVFFLVISFKWYNSYTHLQVVSISILANQFFSNQALSDTLNSWYIFFMWYLSDTFISWYIFSSGIYLSLISPSGTKYLQVELIIIWYHLCFQALSTHVFFKWYQHVDLQEYYLQVISTCFTNKWCRQVKERRLKSS